MKIKLFYSNEQGFSLVESMTALTILTVSLGVAGPLFLNQRVSNINSEIRTGAVAVSQQILDRLRRKDTATMQSSGYEEESLSNMGHQYKAKTYYCLNSSFCGAGSRHIRVEVKNNGKTAYAVETVYTQFR